MIPFLCVALILNPASGTEPREFGEDPSLPRTTTSATGARADSLHAEARARMVREQIRERGIEDEEVLRAMNAVPRHEFVPPDVRRYVYFDSALPIGYGQTISQPYVVAMMTERLELTPDDRVLEVGTGSGYQAAVLAELAAEVYSIEIVPELAARAAADLERLGYRNVRVRAGDGYQGWPEAAPFDAIIITAAPDHIPQPLMNQLARGGRLILPLGDTTQELVLVRRETDGAFSRKRLLPVRFVPMTGEAERPGP